jgi:hypothetical protein
MTWGILTNQEIAELQAHYRPIIRRSDVLEICAAFGYSERDARKMIEGEVPVLRPLRKEILAGTRRHYHRDSTIETLNRL